MSSYVQITRDNTLFYTNHRLSKEQADEIKRDVEEFNQFLERMRKKGIILRVAVPYRPTHDRRTIDEL